MPASSPQVMSDAAAFAAVGLFECKQLAFMRFPPPSPVTSPVVCAVAAPPGVVLLG